MKGIFDSHTQLVHKALDFRSKRNSMLSTNIANLETPGYKAKDLVFEGALGKAMKADIPGPLNTTHAGHRDGRDVLPLQLVKPEVIRTSNPVGNLDGNSVDLETEMVKLGENQVVYQALTRMMSYKFNTLRLSIREGEF